MSSSTTSGDQGSPNVEDLAAQVQELHAVHDNLYGTVAAIQDRIETSGLGPDGADHLAVLDDTVVEVVRQLEEQRAVLDQLLARRDEKKPAPRYTTLHAWVTEQFLPCVEREAIGDHFKWCAQWWDHEEALYELEAMWRSWEQAKEDEANGHAWWLREVFTPIGVGLLLSGTGPFARCRAVPGEERHDPSTTPLPSTPPPAHRVVPWKRTTPNGQPPRPPRRKRRGAPTPPAAAGASTNGEVTHE